MKYRLLIFVVLILASLGIKYLFPRKQSTGFINVRNNQSNPFTVHKDSAGIIWLRAKQYLRENKRLIAGGDITENDINTAAATGALVLGFHVGIAGAVTQLAKRSNVTYQIYKVIYELLDDVRGWLNTLLEPEIVETEIGKLELLAVFKTTKDKVICGGKMLKGKVEPGVTAHVKRGKEDIGEALVVEVKKGAETVTSAMEEEECGLLLERTLVPEAGDTLTFIRRESVARSL